MTESATPTPEEQLEAYLEERQRTLDLTLSELDKTLDNSDGFRRLEAITDEEWDEAQARDDAAAAATGGVQEEPDGV
jgi:hypothetical protein